MITKTYELWVSNYRKQTQVFGTLERCMFLAVIQSLAKFFAENFTLTNRCAYESFINSLLPKFKMENAHLYTVHTWTPGTYNYFTIIHLWQFAMEFCILDFCLYYFMISTKCVYGELYIGNLISVVDPMQTAPALNGHLSHFHFGFWYVCTKYTVYLCVHSTLNAVAIAIPMTIIHFI